MIKKGNASRVKKISSYHLIPYLSLFTPNHLNDAPIDFLMKPPPRSFSVDVGSIHHANDYSSILFLDESDSSKLYTISFDLDYCLIQNNIKSCSNFIST